MRRIRLFKTHPEECFQIGAGPATRNIEIGIKPLEQQRTPARCGISGPKLPDFGFLEDIVTAQYFIRPLSRQHHLVSLRSHQTGKQRHGNRRGPQHGRFRMKDRLFEGRGDILVTAGNAAVIRIEMLDHPSLVSGFVVILVLEPDGESTQGDIALLPDDSGQHGGIDPAGEIRPDRHIST